jgi:hypothetical protein
MQSWRKNHERKQASQIEITRWNEVEGDHNWTLIKPVSSTIDNESRLAWSLAEKSSVMHRSG